MQLIYPHSRGMEAIVELAWPGIESGSCHMRGSDLSVQPHRQKLLKGDLDYRELRICLHFLFLNVLI